MNYWQVLEVPCTLLLLYILGPGLETPSSHLAGYLIHQESTQLKTFSHILFHPVLLKMPLFLGFHVAEQMSDANLNFLPVEAIFALKS